MGAVGATVAHASDTVASTLIRFWCRSLTEPLIGYWSRLIKRRLG